MTEERDFWTAAMMLIERHGTSALRHAAERARTLLDQGDEESSLIWTRLAQTVRQILNRRRGEMPN